MPRLPLCLLLLALSTCAYARAPACEGGRIWADGNGNGVFDAGEHALANIKVSDGTRIATSDAQGRYRLQPEEGGTLFVIKPAGFDLPARANGLPDFWAHRQTRPGPALKYGGIAASARASGCRDFGLRPRTGSAAAVPLDVLVFTDTQAKSRTDASYYRRDIVEPLIGKHGARLGLTLGDVVNDDLSLYPALNQATALLQVPWLHIAGNHDLDFDAKDDADSLRSFRNMYGPDTFAWEEDNAVFVGLDDVIYLPGQKPSYIGGLREQQFQFLQAYLASVPRDRLLVLGMHIPLYDAEPGMETFRHADRARLFALLKDFPHVLVLSGHEHSQRHVYHVGDDGWQGAAPLHEYNVGAACGAFWSGVKDAAGIPDSTMADGTPNGYAVLTAKPGGDYALAWHNARDPADTQIALHAPKVLRRGAWPAWNVYANVYMGQDDTRVEYRIDAGAWKPMKRVEQGDPRLQEENLRDDQAEALRGYDRSPEAKLSKHLWRGALATDLAVGEHAVEVRAFDRWRGEQSAHITYRLQNAGE